MNRDDVKAKIFAELKPRVLAKPPETWEKWGFAATIALWKNVSPKIIADRYLKAG
ncbi:MAG TPA: hypothetical protein VMT34_16365 [Aggregatilineales bacterium]|nr:hypothetical protein [Aggregatilineales bacterium]